MNDKEKKAFVARMKKGKKDAAKGKKKSKGKISAFPQSARFHKSARAWIKKHYKESNQYNPRDINYISISILSNAKKAKVKVTRQDILSWWGKQSKRYLKSYPFKKSRGEYNHPWIESS